MFKKRIIVYDLSTLPKDISKEELLTLINEKDFLLFDLSQSKSTRGDSPSVLIVNIGFFEWLKRLF